VHCTWGWNSFFSRHYEEKYHNDSDVLFWKFAQSSIGLFLERSTIFYNNILISFEYIRVMSDITCSCRGVKMITVGY
jgi:hypothetical protein